MIWPFKRKRHQREHDLAWLCRASFETGYRAGNPNTQTNEWRNAWRDSKPRATLVAMGYIKEEDTYR